MIEWGRKANIVLSGSVAAFFELVLLMCLGEPGTWTKVKEEAEYVKIDYEAGTALTKLAKSRETQVLVCDGTGAG